MPSNQEIEAKDARELICPLPFFYLFVAVIHPRCDQQKIDERGDDRVVDDRTISQKSA